MNLHPENRPVICESAGETTVYAPDYELVDGEIVHHIRPPPPVRKSTLFQIFEDLRAGKLERGTSWTRSQPTDQDFTAFVRALKDRTGSFHGTASRMMVAQILEHRDLDYRMELSKFKQDIMAYLANEGVTVTTQMDSSIEQFAALALGGDLASRWGITGWGSGYSLSAACECALAWVRSLPSSTGGAKGALEEAQIVTEVRKQLELNWTARFQEVELTCGNSGSYTSVPHRRIVGEQWGWRHGDTVFAHSSGLTRLAEAYGGDNRRTVGALFNAGMLRPRKTEKRQKRQKRYFDHIQKDVYEIHLGPDDASP